MRFSSFAALVMLVPLAACAARGPFPSLAPRAVEKELAALDEAEQAPVILPDDPAVATRTAALLAEARAGQNEFEAAVAGAEKAVRSAGPAGSEAWIVAQEAVSGLEAARARTGKALGDLDAFAIERAQASPALSAADQVRIDSAIAEAQAIAARQQDRIARLKASLPTG